MLIRRGICEMLTILLLVIHTNTVFADFTYLQADTTNTHNIHESNQDWYDCSSEVGISSDDIVLSFSNVRSRPGIVTPDSGQTIYKTIKYNNHTGSDPIVNDIKVDFHQYYKLFGKTWMTFLIVHNIDECKEHDNLCPLSPGETTEVVTVHPALNKLTPFGWYRSRQIYKDGYSGELIGCVDMRFKYARSTEIGGGLRGNEALTE